MMQLIKTILFTNKILKVLSLIIGFGTWYCLSELYVVTQSVAVPVCFYNVPNVAHITANPEKIMVELAGKRNDLKACQNMGYHIDGASLALGEQIITLDKEQLLVPSIVKVNHIDHTKIRIQVAQK